ncbi:MAG: type IV toxin-antitoxin system AbiEi family antitoxin [Thiotrichales bacterium]
MDTIDLPERDLLPKALAALESSAGVKLRIDQQAPPGSTVDAYLSFEGGRADSLAAILKKRIQPAGLGGLLHQFQSLEGRAILVTDYVNPNLAERLRNEEIAFLDGAGNAFIDIPPVYVCVTGKRPSARGGRNRASTNRAFDKTGLKVVFAFLCNPGLLKASYREIAEHAGVAVGTVGWVLNGLKAAGLILDKGKGKGRKFLSYQKLLDRWLVAYPEKLRPKLYLGTFLADDPDWWKSLEIGEFGAVWSGEVAAAKYTNHLVPIESTVYLPKGAEATLLSKARLRKAAPDIESKAGLVELYRNFGSLGSEILKNKANEGLAPPVLVYADLIASADPRNREVARMIYEEYLAQYCESG